MCGKVTRKALSRVSNFENLTRSESAEVFGEIMSGEVDEIVLSAFLTALKMKGETADEIVGAARAMRSRAEFINAGAKSPVDTCGTGGDGLDTFNISTIAAFIAAGAGVCVAKHGNRAATSKCGSADLLSALGFNLEADPALMEHCLQENGIAFLFAPKMHPAMCFAARVRKSVGFRTIFNLLGPLVNPAGAVGQVVGVFSSSKVELVAECLRSLGARRAFVVHSAEGMDEISPFAPTRVCELRNGSLKTFEFYPQNYLDQVGSFSDLAGGDALQNAAITVGILKGEILGSPRNACVLNSAAAILAGGAADSFAEAVDMARVSIESGAAFKKLERLVEFSRR